MNPRFPFAPGVITTTRRRSRAGQFMFWLDRAYGWLLNLLLAVVLVALAALIGVVFVSNHLDTNLLTGVITP